MQEETNRLHLAVLELHQAVRRSHCDHAKRCSAEHKCMGTTTITPRGVLLSCPLCGNADLNNLATDACDVSRAFRISSAVAAAAAATFDEAMCVQGELDLR